MTITYVPRAFGSTIVIVISNPSNPAVTTTTAYARDGKVTATARDGHVTATARDGKVLARGR